MRANPLALDPAAAEVDEVEVVEDPGDDQEAGSGEEALRAPAGSQDFLEVEVDPGGLVEEVVEAEAEVREYVKFVVLTTLMNIV